jgi:hypothetical protein
MFILFVRIEILQLIRRALICKLPVKGIVLSLGYAIFCYVNEIKISLHFYQYLEKPLTQSFALISLSNLR